MGKRGISIIIEVGGVEPFEIRFLFSPMLVPLYKLLTAAAAVVSSNATDSSPSVTLPTGATITGTIETSVAGTRVHAFLGLPYAEPPVGDKRWRQSTLKPITADVNATAYGNICYGNPAHDAASGQFPASEDCLYLNVFAPAGATSTSKLPVMVWVHGGNFEAGAGNVYDGTNLIGASEQKVILVNFNYRLGALGFLSNDDILKQGDGANFGLRDQEVAFQWVQKYISAFGGNPDDVTAFGESAGGLSLGWHMLARHGTQRLFHRAILQSGAYTTVQDTPSRARQANQTRTLAAAVGCLNATAPVLDCLRNVDAFAISAATMWGYDWYPTVDSVFMLEAPFARLVQGKVSRIPTIIGTNTDDGWYFASPGAEASRYESFTRKAYSLMTDDDRARLATLYPPANFATPHHRTSEIMGDSFFVCPAELFSAILSRGVDATFHYRFNYVSSDDFGIPLVLHAKDLDFVFNRQYNLKNDTTTRTLVQQMQRFWTNFAITGSPNIPVASDVVWPRFNTTQRKEVLLGSPVAVETNGAYMPGHSKRCTFWYAIERRHAFGSHVGVPPYQRHQSKTSLGWDP
jgi:para-nitrobenzyl esterase